MDTTALGIEYPEGTDAIRDLPAIQQAAAESIDALITAAIAPPTKRTASIVVANSVAETDLTGGSFVVPANALGPNGTLRLRLWGDALNNTGAYQFGERFKVKLGAAATVVIDTNSDTSNNGGSKVWAPGTIRAGWVLDVELQNRGLTNVQLVQFRYKRFAGLGNGAIGNHPFAVGTGESEASAGSGTPFGMNGYNAAAIDTTAAMPVVVSLINPVAAAGFEYVCFGGIMEVL